mmetsp:Transcript_18166/g.61812  ORF Transcript_18166/g.61812 Transcript_18166/m.61812 type:complete len:80 (+) Transcript_18166:368-607(+)
MKIAVFLLKNFLTVLIIRKCCRTMQRQQSSVSDFSHVSTIFKQRGFPYHSGRTIIVGVHNIDVCIGHGSSLGETLFVVR